MDAGQLSRWIGAERREQDRVDLFPVRAMSALLDRDPASVSEGDPLPPGWHWLLFRTPVLRGETGPDGHERRGAFLPPVPLPRRMWAGGSLSFSRPLRVGDRVERVSRVRSVEFKEGRSGPLAFVSVDHEVTGPGGVAVREVQDLVYRGGGGPSRDAPASPPSGPQWSRSVTLDEAALFRFSALTFNGHRIHYDHPYATGVEGYPGLVVHAPLVALLLLEEAVAAGVIPVEFRYRARSPHFCGRPLHLQGRRGAEGGARIWATDPEGGLVMEGELLPLHQH